ncbi:MAG: SDR family oxidoreductase [Anaerolineae bacterium]
MTQKVVLISGATSGIGLVTANKLHELGWKVYAGGLQGDNFLKLQYGITQLPFDITDSEDIAGAVKLIMIESGRLDALVNNAGIQIAGPLESLSMAQLRKQFNVNLFGHVEVTQAVLPMLHSAPDARIVNVSSLMGSVTMPLLGAYSMSKHALEAYSDALRLELAPSGIHVATVTPGAIATPMSDHTSTSLAQLRDDSPLEMQKRYHALFEGMLNTLDQQNASATPPEAIADAIIDALTSDNPRPRYIIGSGVRGLTTLHNLLPTRLWDHFLKRVLGIHHK